MANKQTFLSFQSLSTWIIVCIAAPNHCFYHHFDQRSPHRRTPLREDSVCQLLENSCDLSDEEIELLVEEGQPPVFLHAKNTYKPASKINDLNFDPNLGNVSEDEESWSQSRDSFPLGAGCLPCTPKSNKKKINPPSYHPAGGNSANWCCGVVASTVKKTTKKL